MTTTAPAVPATDMELLAPAGTLAAFAAALEAGADAVYVGAPGLNARALARDFTFAEIAAMTHHAHEQGRRLYVAMNSLVKEGELRLALENLEALARIGPDALIIQDLGLLHPARRFFPELRLHASTLMTATSSLGGALVRFARLCRVVLARELSTGRDPHRRRAKRGGAGDFHPRGHVLQLLRAVPLLQPARRQVEPARPMRAALPPPLRLAAVGQAGRGRRRPGRRLPLFHERLERHRPPCGARAAGVVSLKIEGGSSRWNTCAARCAPTGWPWMPWRLRPAGASNCSPRRTAALDESMGRKRSPGFFVPGAEAGLIVPRLSGNTGEVVGRVVRLELTGGRKSAARPRSRWN